MRAGRVRRAAITEQAPTGGGQGAGQEGEDGASGQLVIDFDNESDPDATVVSIEGENQVDLLRMVTGAFAILNIHVLDAMIKTCDDGRVMDVFRVVAAPEPAGSPDPTGSTWFDRTDDRSKDRSSWGQLSESRWPEIKNHISEACSNTNKSSQPAIYGVAAAAEITKLRPMVQEMVADEGLSSEQAAEVSAVQLELAAAEMARAAAEMVRLERDLNAAQRWVGSADSPEGKIDAQNLMSLETARSEAAAVLERHMSAMEALLSARRTPEGSSTEGPSAARGGGADLRFSLGGGTGSGPAAGKGLEVFLQGFNWESHSGGDWYKYLKSNLEAIHEAGFTTIWLPPPTNSVSPQGYLPRDLYDLEARYGSQEDLMALLESLHSRGMKGVADIVINHRCAHSQDDQGRWNVFGGRLAWDAAAITRDNAEFGGHGARGSGEDYTAAPNIDHSQERIRQDLINWLKWLRKSIGYDGWRFDYVKGYSGEFTREYIDGSVPSLAFGEFWDACDYTDGVLDYNQDRHRQRIVDWCDKTGGTSAAFDFTTKGILQEAVVRGERWRLVDAQGRPSGFMGLWPSRAVTFIENHDTGSTLGHWPFPSNHLHEGYAYILTHPGTPCVFWDHWEQPELRQSIKALLKIRKEEAIDSRAQIKILSARAHLYSACINGRVCMKIGKDGWSPNGDSATSETGKWHLATSGPNFAVWTLTEPADLPSR